MSDKRILILTNRVPYPLNDGGNLAMHAMIEGYHDAGWQVFVLAMNTSRHKISVEKLATIYTHVAGFETVETDNDVHLLPTLKNYLFSRKPNHADRFYNKEFQHRIAEALRKFQPDAIQVESVFLSEYIPAIRKETPALLILRLHNIEYQVWQRLAAETTSPLKKIYLHNLATRMARYEPEVWAQYDLLLPITDNDASIAKTSQPGAEIMTIPFGINTHEYLPAEKARWGGYHIGAMDWLPNAEAIKWFLQTVWPSVHKALPDFRFHYAGRNMPLYCKQMSLPNVVCEGEVVNAARFIADKKILIVPLRSGGGIRVKILEGMAAGKVVITTAIGIQGIDAKDGVHYLEANQPADFVEKLKWIMANKEVAEAIGQNAMKLVKDKYERQTFMLALTDKITRMLQ